MENRLRVLEIDFMRRRCGVLKLEKVTNNENAQK